ncbi:PqiB family protein [Teichococcus vastitatis]|uniref:MlaD family protein n=1 Tax=Teichococcus vastitatis TaxID=2307076 RepID=A0ABS9W7F5_9PROT|nr:MlaD family protein [Pseudoroseomonas vastitatis]MCI0755206.1 MlaD family protein [Pseudoroseomonas vastitatis]
MSDTPPRLPPERLAPELAEARPQRRRFSLIWLIPLAALMVTGYLAYTTISSRGPLITVHFNSADGLAAGQTQVRYKSVAIGTVEAIALADDLSSVTARIRMTPDVEARLTEAARFWVVRPRLTAGNVSGLETIVSGAYIEFDPGPEDGEARREYRGLEDPPGIRSDEPGRIFTLKTYRLGSLNRGSPVFFRDVQVGEVLSFDQPGLDGTVAVRAFIRSPYEAYVREGSRFWNSSGVRLGFGPDGLSVELESLRAVLTGGIAFDTPPRDRDAPPAPDNAQFTLYGSAEAALAATSENRLEFLVYLEGSVRGLTPRSPVEMRGIRIGSVTNIDLSYDQTENRFSVPVRIAVEPDRIAFPNGRPQWEVRQAMERFVAEGMRAQLASGNLLTGQKVVTLDFVPDAPPATVRQEGDLLVIPSLGGGGDDLMGAVGAIAGKLENFPLDQIGQNLSGVLAAVNGLVGGPELKASLSSLTAILGDAQRLVRRTDNGLAPLLRRLPSMADNLDQTLARANAAVTSVERGYGTNSAFNRELARLLQQATDAARSVRLLADYLERHPEALLRGRTE